MATFLPRGTVPRPRRERDVYQQVRQLQARLQAEGLPRSVIRRVLPPTLAQLARGAHAAIRRGR